MRLPRFGSLFLAVALLTVAACDSKTEAPRRSTAASGTTADGVRYRVVAEKLNAPWGAAFLPNGTALVTERNSHKILAIKPDGTHSTAQTVPDVKTGGEGGLLGIAVSPRYAEDSTVFVYYTTPRDNRIAALKLGETPRPIVTGIPSAGNHNGGRLAFGPDGYLYASTGDAGNRSTSQDLTSLGGKILRLKPDGTPPPDNPFPNSLVYSYGHRNVQGLAWHKSGRMYAPEFGQNTWDELNRIEPGKNYGWPTVEGPSDRPGFVSPIAAWPTSDASPSGATIVDNVVVVAGLRGERLWCVPLNSAGDATPERRPVSALDGEFGRLRHVAVAPDGSVWLLTSNTDGRGSPGATDDRIIRLELNPADVVK